MPRILRFPPFLFILRLLEEKKKITQTFTIQEGRDFEVSLPYLRKPVPLVIVFRGSISISISISISMKRKTGFTPYPLFFSSFSFKALGIVSDGDILSYICYNLGDQEMLELLRPSFEKTQIIQSQEAALDYIGKRTSNPGVTQDKRIKHAAEILQKEVLSHVGTGTDCGKKKAFFFAAENKFSRQGVKPSKKSTSRLRVFA